MIYCDECGFGYLNVRAPDIPAALTALAPEYGARLAADPRLLRHRPDPEVWSALEYACHVRDVLDVQRGRLALALAESRPEFVPMGRDERVTRDRYNDQDPRVVAAELARSADALAAAFAGLREDEWQRTGIYNYPTRAERSMVWLGQHTVHEGLHHLTDIDAVLTKGATGG